mmetsp:Transcript_7042/g.17905  ORF Transcript_7042/g.17905 Transcript_7042/m.17905 type:complete len:185 (-) Transcript_7042:109-663(-)
MAPPRLTIEIIKGNGVGPHGNGPVAMYPVGRGLTSTFYDSKPIGMGTISMPNCGDRNNSMDSSFQTRHNIYVVEFQKYFIVKNLKVLLEKQVPEYPHTRQRMVLNGQVLEDHKELSEYGITAASSSHLKVQMYLVDDPPPKPGSSVLLAGKRRDSDGRRAFQPPVNPTGKTGHDFATTISHFMP